MLGLDHHRGTPETYLNDGLGVFCWQSVTNSYMVMRITT